MSETEQPDPAKALTEGFRALGRVASEWLEQWRPVINALAEFASRPEVRAAVEQAQARRLLREAQPCHCLCGKMHPADKGICCFSDAVTTRRFATAALGPVEVPLCAPCLVAQGFADLTA
jgi:hypothetical protein